MGNLKLFALFAGMLSLSMLSSGCISFGSGADGVATDSIARVSYGGWVWKTWRVQLTNDHPVATADGGINEQRYGVEDNSVLIASLQHYSETGEKVKLYYHGKLFVWDWESSDADVIYKVEQLNQTR